MDGKSSGRVASVDTLRGIAVLQMIFWQIFDFLAKVNIYADSPLFIQEFNMPPHFSVFFLFMSMSGASLYLSFLKRRKEGLRKKDIAKHVLKRYGRLILISLLFTGFVFGFCTFFGWDEAVQGIGLTAIIMSLLLLVDPSNKILVAIAMILFLLRPFAMESIPKYTENYPRCVTEYNLKMFVISLVLNSFVRGFFSVFNLLPLMITGTIFIKMLLMEKMLLKKSALMSLGMLLVALFLHFLGLKIDFYARSYSSILLEVGTFLGLYSVTEYLSKTRINLLVKPLENFGRGAFIAYFAHFLLIYKPLQLLNLAKSLPTGLAALFSVILTVIIYSVIRFWLKRKEAK
jgi:hypothetical protein